ncbi:uncharacterized protein LOC126986337 [Eriocheir sinensis]|uniref:uncharacterized protein LOC126986337 n=1 Tax=Eriocheir sinensis TaxID=95602 RepID=UPI0021C9DFD5|nr:uncharacterized protein LOC126986337 [Eriocheir sinensis]
MLLGRHHRRPSTPPHTTTTTTNSDDHSDSDDTFFVPRPQKRPPCDKRRFLTRTSAPVLPSTTPPRPYGDVGFGDSATSRNPSPRVVKSDRNEKIGTLRTNLRALDDEFCDVNLGTNTASLRNPNFSGDPNKEITEKTYSDSDPNRNTDTRTKSSLYNDEFCDVSLENAEVRNANPNPNKTTSNTNNVRKNLRQIASKIRVGPKLAQGNTTRSNPTSDPGGEDSSSQVDLPPFAAFSDPSGRVSDAPGVLPKGSQCLQEGNHGLKPSQQPPCSSDPRDEDMGVLSKRILAPREDCQAPQQPPCGIVAPPVGYSGLSSLMYEADDTTFADSDTATAGSDSGVLCASSRRRRTSSSVEEKREERGGEEGGGGGGIGGRVRERIATWMEERENNEGRGGGRGGGGGSHEPSRRKPSLVDGLLLSIYRHHQRNRSSSIGESDTLTEHSTTSEPPFPPPPAASRYHRGRAYGCSSSSSSFVSPPPPPPCCSSSSRVVLRKFRLLSKDVAELRLLVSSLQASLSGQCALLVRELKKRDKLRHRRDHRNDLITAVLHALSLKRSEC